MLIFITNISHLELSNVRGYSLATVGFSGCKTSGVVFYQTETCMALLVSQLCSIAVSLPRETLTKTH